MNLHKAGKEGFAAIYKLFLYKKHNDMKKRELEEKQMKVEEEFIWMGHSNSACTNQKVSSLIPKSQSVFERTLIPQLLLSVSALHEICVKLWMLL